MAMSRRETAKRIGARRSHRFAHAIIAIPADLLPQLREYRLSHGDRKSVRKVRVIAFFWVKVSP